MRYCVGTLLARCHRQTENRRGVSMRALAKLSWCARRPLELDGGPDDIELEFELPAHAPALVRYYLRRMLEESADAMELFFHEEDGCVRICLHRNATWLESVPCSPACGLHVVRLLRRACSPLAGRYRPLVSRLGIVWRHEARMVHVYSPHQWDIRIATGEIPALRPYALVLQGRQ